MAQLKSKQLTYPLSGSFTGSLFGTSSYAITASYAMNGGGGGGTPGGNFYEVQYNNNGAFGGVTDLTYSGSILRATGSFSGSFTGLINSASYAATASYAPDYLLISQTGSMTVLSASYASSSLSASYSISSSYSDFSISSSYSQTSSYSLDAISSSYAATASYAGDYLPLTGGTITGNLVVTGTGSFSYLHVTYESASVIYSSGSNQFGDAADDVQTLYGAVNIPTGSLTVSGSTIITGSLTVTSGITGSLFGTSSFAISASYAVSSSHSSTSISASYALSASYATSASYALSSSYSVSSSYASVANYANTAGTASYAAFTTQMDVYVMNKSGNTINKGVVVRIDNVGNSSETPRIVTASYENDNNSANTLGITTQTIADNGFGYVITEGILTGINTSAFVAGQLIYLGATGSITGSAPLAPLHAVRLGEVVKANPGAGIIYVRIDNGYELGELHNVLDNSTTSSYGDLLIKSGSIWTNSKTLSGSYVLSGSLTTNDGVSVQTLTASVVSASSFTGSLFGTASWAVQSITASYVTGSNVYGPFGSNSIISSSYAVSSSYSISSSIASTASYVQTAQTASYVLNAVSSSYALTASYSVSSSFATTAQSAPLYVLTADTASMTVLSSSYATTASYVQTSQTASYVLNAVSSSFASTASYVTASNVYGPFGGNSVVTSSYSITASYALTSEGGGSGAGFPFTGSAVITGSLIVTGSATFTDSIQIDATLVTASIVTTTGAATTTILTQATGSYRSMFAKYTVSNAANARAGEFMAVWNAGNIQYTDTSTTDIGDTNALVLTGSLTATSVQLSTGVAAGWTIKTQTIFV